MLVRYSRFFLFFLLLSSTGSFAARAFALPKLNATPDPLDFLEINLTDVKDAEVEIESKESDPLVIQNIYLTGGNARESEFRILSPAVKTFPMMPGEKRKIILRFSPDFEGHRTRLLIIQTDSGDKVIQLEGTGKLTKPVLALSATSLNFGQIGVTGKREMLVEISNVGEDPAKISDVTLANFTGVEHFKAGLNDASQTFPIILLKEEKLMIKVTFEGANPLGFKTGSLTLVGSVGGQTVVQLEGEVIAGDLKIEPSPIDFGDVEVGQAVRKKVTLTTVGSLALTIEYINEMLAPFVYVVTPGTPFVLEPGKPYEFEIEINATEAGPVFSQLQVVSQDLDGPKLRTADIIANVLTPLRVAESQDFNYYCGSKLGVERTVTLGNKGLRPITIETLNLPVGVTLISQLPFDVPATGTINVEYAFDPSTGFDGRELVFEFGNDFGVLIRDTVLVNERDATLPLVQTVDMSSPALASSVAVTSSFDFTDFAFSDITFAIDIARPDLFVIVKDSIRLNTALLPNATFDLNDNGNGSYTLVIHAANPIAFDPQVALADQPLFTYSPFAYISTDSESEIGIHLAIDTLCVSTPIASAHLVAQDFCGSTFVHQVLNDQPLSNLVISPNPSASNIVRISYTSHVSALVSYKVMSMTGAIAMTGSFEATAGEGSAVLTTSDLAEGNYILELSSDSGFAKQVKLVVLR